ncbi:UDP-Glycosyltransferase superfamily protein [Forsythia ovata]|uniref:UDP-Glycosyltransferase superfamily protein n=1 Tax=Forsythia ovata TaxID=205694 RepID=A0ABD1XAL7_9LAMI
MTKRRGEKREVKLLAIAGINGLLSLHESPDEPFILTNFPWIKLIRNDFDYPFNKNHPSSPLFDLIMEISIALSNSYGLLVNSFYELEPLFVDYLTRESKPKAFCQTLVLDATTKNRTRISLRVQMDSVVG